MNTHPTVVRRRLKHWRCVSENDFDYRMLSKPHHRNLARILVIIKLTGISKPGVRKKFYNSFVEPGPRRQLSS